MTTSLRSIVAAWFVGFVALMSASLAVHAAEDFLDPAVAFKFSARMLDARTIEARWTIADGYYMYRERFAFKADEGARLGEARWPAGKIKFDETFNKNVETFRQEVVVRVPIENAPERFVLTGVGQGCADQGLCYPPIEVKVALERSNVANASTAKSGASSPTTISSIATSSTAPRLDDDGRIRAALKSGSLAVVMPVFALFGLLLSFTPCVLPMVPILSSLIVGSAGGEGTVKRVTRSRGLGLAFAYSIGMAIVYTAMGIAAGLAGEGLAAALQTPAVLAAFAVLLIVLALSMFGFYELQLPSALQSRLTGWSNRQRGGAALGAFTMGAISALIVGPCVAAPLAGALLYISQTRDVVIGGAALFSLAIGMSVPLLLVGASASAWLPRAGAWMAHVRHFFGALLIAVAIWMVSPVLPAWLHMLAWAALFIIGAVHLRVFDALPADASGWSRCWKGVGALLFVLGTVLVVGVASGSRDLLQPLDRLASARVGGAASDAAAGHDTAWVKVDSIAQLDAALTAAQGRPAMLDFYADWCVSCKEMERFTFSEPRVAAQLDRFVLIKADVTQNDANAKALLARFRLFGPPGILFFDAQGREREDRRVIGFQNADLFLSSLMRATQP